MLYFKFFSRTKQSQIIHIGITINLYTSTIFFDNNTISIGQSSTILTLAIH